MPSTREQALAAAWESCGKPCPLPIWQQTFADWDIEPVHVGGRVVGAVFARGPEIHAAVLPEARGRWVTPRLWRWAVTDRLQRYGKLVTRGRSGNRFIERAGFRAVACDGDCIIYERASQ